MQKVNQIFTDTYFCARVLINSTRLRDTFEKNRDIEIESTNDDDEKQEIQNTYKKKLQPVYRIRNNAFSFLLYNGFQCTYDENEEGEKTFYMDIEGTTYDCKESAVKNILAKDFERVVENCLSKEEYEKIKNEINIIPDSVKEVINYDENVESTLTDGDVNDLLDLFMGGADTQFTEDVKSTEPVKMEEPKMELAPAVTKEQEISVSTNLEKKEPVSIKMEPPKPKSNRCPKCFAPLSDDIVICNFCGNNLAPKKIAIENEFEKDGDEEKFSDEDIDRMFEELEKRLNAQSSSSLKTDTSTLTKPTVSPDVKLTTKNTKKTSKTNSKDDPDISHVRLYDDSKSTPTVDKNNLIADIYTLKLRDPRGDNEEKIIQDIHRRRKVDEESIVEFNSDIPDVDEVIRDIKICVYPIAIPENGTELSSDILIYVEQDGKSGLFCSGTEGTKTVRVDTNIHSFLVRGSWKNGIFESLVLLSGVSIAEQCEISRSVEKIRPVEDNLQLGHTLTTLSVEYVDGTESVRIHAIPLSMENESDGLTKTIYLMENYSQNERKLYVTKATNYISFDFEDEIYKVSSKWVGDTFKTKVENY